MKTLNLFVDFEFTSLSPDAQCISVGIVSDTFWHSKLREEEDNRFSKSFYAEFSDFDINRCDDWVKENVISKLKYYPNESSNSWEDDSRYECCLNTGLIKEFLKLWLSQFSDYNLQFICDCGTYDFYWLVQLLANWNMKIIETDGCPICSYDAFYACNHHAIKTGLPKLPANISPVPFDLNDLIAIKKGITPKEAFDLNREELLPANEDGSTYGWGGDNHNALFDAEIIKEIYNKLK